MNGISDEIGDTILDDVNDVSLNTPVSIIDSNGVHIGSHYAILASGGFSTSMTLTDISFIGGDIGQVITFDLTETVQIDYDVRLFNEKIGLNKDASNSTILSTAFDASTNSFPTDSFDISFQEFRHYIDISHVASVGAFVRSFNAFELYLNQYFYFADGFNSLLKPDSYDDLSNNTFDAGALVSLLNDTREDASGNSVDAFNGIIQLSGVNNLLELLSTSNPFSNRTDVSGRYLGFLEGDLILVDPGMSLTLQLVIKNETYIPSTDNTNVFILDQSYNAPLLLRLQNLS